MRQIDRKKFFDSHRGSFGVLDQSQVDALEALLFALEADERITDLRHAAYMLATVRHETAKTYRPIKEYGQGKNYKYGRVDPITGKVYFGRGFVQLTWKDNYKTMGDLLKVDLVHNPDLALDPAIAYRIMSCGMRLGMFTGVGLSRYIHGETCDYVAARKIINGTDCAEKIAAYAENFEAAIRAAMEATT